MSLKEISQTDKLRKCNKWKIMKKVANDIIRMREREREKVERERG